MQDDDISNKPYVPEDEPVDNGLCRNCKELPIEPGHALQICHDCRQKFIKFPIPKWIWGFAGLILIIMVAGLWRMPKYLSAAIHLAKGEKAIEEHRYRTAQRELEKVVAVFPDDTEMSSKLLIATAYNYDVARYITLAQKLEGRPIEDDALLQQMTTASELVLQHFPDDTLLVERLEQLKNNPDSLEAIFFSLNGSKDQKVAGNLIANYFYDGKMYRRADSLLTLVVKESPDMYAARGLQIATKRELGDYEGAIAICNQLLAVNKEDVSVISARVRVELKRKNDKQAREYAEEAMAIDDQNISSMEAMAMCEYFAGKKEASNKLLAAIRASEQAEGDTTISHRLAKIFSGEEVYR